MKKHLSTLLSLLLIFSLLLPSAVAAEGAAGTPALSGVYRGGVVTVTGSNLAASTDYPILSVTSAQGLVAFTRAETDETGALTAAVTTGALTQGEEYHVRLYSAAGTLVLSGDVTFATEGGNGGSEGGNEGSGSSGGSSSGKTDTTINTNPDGSTTTTVVDKATGAVTETVRHPDGTQVIQETTPEGETSTTVALPKKVLDAAQGGNTVLDLPITPVETVKTGESAPTVTIQVPASSSSASVSVRVPVTEITPGTVAIVVNPDGTETVLRDCLPTQEGLQLEVEGSVTVKIVDNSKEFDDVTATDWYSDAISFTSGRELFKGTSETTFAPDLTMTRGMFVTVLHALENNPEADVTGHFTDLASDTWYSEAVNWAAEKQVISGYGNGTVGAEDTITREQLAMMLWNYAGKPATGHALTGYSDTSDISSYAYIALAWAVEQGILNGTTSGQLLPGGQASRAEAAQMLMRYMLLG